MITLPVKVEILKEEYPEFYKLFKETLKKSNGKYSKYDDSKINCFYYISTFLKPSQKNEEYYENLMKMKYPERLNEELNKTRVTLTMVAGRFAITDHTDKVGVTALSMVEKITSRKMYFEQSKVGDESVMNSIPDLDKLEKDIEKENELRDKAMDALGLGDLLGGEENILGDLFGSKKEKKSQNPEDILKSLISEEKYEEAEEYLEKHPELKKKK